MNELQLLRHHDALVTLARRGHFMQVTYLHDMHCPCATGIGAALPDCCCQPIIEVDGASYMVDDAGNLLVIERR